MKKQEETALILTRPVKLAMLRSLAAGKLDEENKSIISNFLSPDGAITVEIIDNPIQVESLSFSEFETIVQKIRRERYSGNI